MFKLIKNRVGDFIWNGNGNGEFETLFEQAFELYKTHIKKCSVYGKAKKSAFARFLSFYAYKNMGKQIFFSEKDIGRLRNPQKGVHTKHSFEIVCVLLHYVGKNVQIVGVQGVTLYIAEMNDNVVYMKKLLLNPEVIDPERKEKVIERIKIQQDRIDYYIDSKREDININEKNIY